MKKFVCSFRGRRDAYQVPLALAEDDLLDRFITDFYAFPELSTLFQYFPAKQREKLRNRYEPEIPNEKIKCLWGTTALEHFRHFLRCKKSVTFAKLDRHFSLSAAACAKKQRSDLFLYSPYAWEAFTAKYRHHPRKILFQYHPHQAFEREILAKNFAQHPYVSDSYNEDTGEQLNACLARRNADAWRFADLIFCASSFTKQSLLAVGADESKCRVVPYGVGLPTVENTIKASGNFQVLFVGSGIQRKGLHHLLQAWKNAMLPADSQLILVCRFIDPGIARMVSQTPRVKLLRGISGNILGELFSTSALFAMPSLVEGFGQVYLEALSQGCPVLGTPHTCLPDLGNEADGIFMVPSDCNIDALVHQLEFTSKILPNNFAIRQNARACAMRFTWEKFRTGIRQALVRN